MKDLPIQESCGILSFVNELVCENNDLKGSKWTAQKSEAVVNFWARGWRVVIVQWIGQRCSIGRFILMNNRARVFFIFFCTGQCSFVLVVVLKIAKFRLELALLVFCA